MRTPPSTLAPRLGLTIFVLTLLGLSTAPAVAQFEQYTLPGGDFEGFRETMQERLERNMREAPLRLGRFFFSPWTGLRNVAYIDNVGGAARGPTESDFTATGGAGIRLYRPIGAETTFAAHALPEYVWWKDLAGRRRVNGRYGAGLFANLGRTGFELSATRTEDATFFSAELEEPVNTLKEELTGRLEIELFGGLAVFASSNLRSYEFPGDEDTPPQVEQLNRDEEILRGGVRFPLFGGLQIGLGVERSEAEFDSLQGDRSNSGTAPILELELQGSALVFTADLAARDLEAEMGSSFAPYDEITGRMRVSFRPTGRTDFQLFADRNLVYSLAIDRDYFENTRYGAAIQTSLSSFASLRVFASTGVLDFAPSSEGAPFREDDFDSFGGETRIRLGRLELLIGFRETKYDSNLPAFDRSVTVIRSGLTFGRVDASPWG